MNPILHLPQPAGPLPDLAAQLSSGRCPSTHPAFSLRSKYRVTNPTQSHSAFPSPGQIPPRNAGEAEARRRVCPPRLPPATSIPPTIFPPTTTPDPVESPPLQPAPSFRLAPYRTIPTALPVHRESATRHTVRFQADKDYQLHYPSRQHSRHLPHLPGSTQTHAP